MEQIKLKASIRQEIGKNAIKIIRKNGLVPAVVYHRGDSPVVVSVNDREITKIIRASAGENVLINLSIDKDKKSATRAVIIKDVHRDPVKRTILHVDFNEISLTEKIFVEVEVIAQGEPIGVKQDGGVLEHGLRMIKIQCLPTDIPKHIDVDVAGLKLNGSIHVKDLKVSDKIKIVTDPETLILQVKKHEEKVEVVDPLAAPAEVEVIREKKEEDSAKPGAEKAKDEPKKEAAKPEKK